MAAELLLLDPRRVGRMGDVDGERQVGLERERRRGRALGADLLLDRRHGRHPALEGRPARGPGAAPRGRRRRRGDCRAIGRPACPPPSRTGSAAITTGSPTRTRSSASSSSRRRCRCACREARRPSCAARPSAGGWACARPRRGRCPPWSAPGLRWPIRIWASQPPIGAKYRKPFSSTCVITSPISSMCPTTASSGAAPSAPIRATEEPRASVLSEANEAARRQTSLAGPS